MAVHKRHAVLPALVLGEPLASSCARAEWQIGKAEVGLGEKDRPSINVRVMDRRLRLIAQDLHPFF